MMKLNIQLFASGNITFATSGALQGKIDWTSTSNGSTANTSTVTARIYARRTSGTTTGREWSGNVNIGGNNHTYSQIYTGTSTTIGTSWVLMQTYSDTITHDDNGQKTITISGSVSGPSGTSLAGVTSSGSGSAVLDTIPRASVLNNTTFNPETWTTLDITKYVESYYHKLWVLTLNATNTAYEQFAVREGVENGDVITLTSEELATYYSMNTARKDTEIKVFLDTYTDDTMTTQVGSLLYKLTNYTITNANPTFTDFDYADTNATTTALTGDSSIIVSRYSNVKVDVPTAKKAVAIKGATMKSYNVNGTLRPYVDSFTYTINGINATELVVYAIDSRSNQTRVSKALNVKAYTDLVKLTQGATREDGVGSQVTFDITGTYWNYSFGSVTNDVTATYRYRITGTTTWTTGLTPITLVKNGANFSFNNILRGDAVDNGFNIANGYEIEIIVSDKLTTQTFNCNISPSSPALEIYKNNVSLGGIYDEALGGRVQGIYDIGDLFITTNNINPSIKFGGTWVADRTYYGGELIAYGVVNTTGAGSSIAKDTTTAFSDSSVGAKAYNVVNYVSGILTGTGGTLSVQTLGIVGMVEANIFIAGLGATGTLGIWWKGNSNILPSGVTMVGGNDNNQLATGPIGANYGGNTNTYLYKVDTTSDVQFYVDPTFIPYNGAFTPSADGTVSQMFVKVFAKYGTTYSWKRTA